MKSSFYGFWLSYIDTMTAFALIFLLLFSVFVLKESKLNKEKEELLLIWQKAKKELEDLDTYPVRDSIFGGIRLTIADSILFPLNSYNLTTNGKAKVDTISKVLIEFLKNAKVKDKTFRINIGGHTDALGGDTVNFVLSFYRALSVANQMKEIFRSSDIDTSLIFPVGYGSKFPAIPGYVQPKNRRITIVIQLLSSELIDEI